MRTVLVVDDEFGVAEVLEAILEDEGYRVVTANNGKQGLARLAEVKADLVLLDVMMPILNGPGMLRAMLADPAFKDIPVIMMSSLDEGSIRDELNGAPYAAFVRKPFRTSLISDIVARVLEGGPPSAN
jgi:CheY-like chemotaxis protein